MRILIIVSLMLATLTAETAVSTTFVDVEDEINGAIEDLESRDLKRRYWATVTLARFPAAAGDSLPLVPQALTDASWQVRAGAARALEELARHGFDVDPSPLVAALADPDESVRVAASYALAEVASLPAEAWLQLEVGLNDSHDSKVACAYALMQAFPERVGVSFSPTKMAQVAAYLLQRQLDAEAAGRSSGTWQETHGQLAARLGRVIACLDPEVANSVVGELIERYRGSDESSVGCAVQAMGPQRARLLEAKCPLLRRRLGHYRAPLQPTRDTNTLGRDGFYIHGGLRPGSAGCIDVGKSEEWLFPII